MANVVRRRPSLVHRMPIADQWGVPATDLSLRCLVQRCRWLGGRLDSLSPLVD